MKHTVLKFWLMIACFLCSFSVWSQVNKISGKVTSDEDNKPLIGVSVVVKGKTSGTQTKSNGEFTIDAATGDVLVFSYTGFTPQEIAVGSDITIDLKNSRKFIDCFL